MSTQEGARDTETGEAHKGMDAYASLPLPGSAAGNSPLPLVYSDGLTHIVRYVNPAFCRLVGKEVEELIGRPFALAVPGEEASGCIALLGRVYHTDTTETLADHQYAPTSLPGVFWSYVAWPVHDAREHPIGVMMQVTNTSATVDAREKATLVSEALLLYGLAHHELADALHEREQAVSHNEALHLSLAEQNALTTALNDRLKRAMQETHHRVKNNLQIVSALAEIQMNGDMVPTSALQRIVSHVRTLAALHDILTQRVKDNTSTAMLDTTETFSRLLPLLQGSIGTRRIHSEIAEIMLPINNSASLSLLVSELISNAVKHGKGDISVTLRREEDRASLTVADRGRGFPDGFDPRKAANTGLELILSLARHDLRGEITFENGPEGGAQVVVTFPVLAFMDTSE